MEVLSEPDSSLIIELLLHAGPAGFPVVLTLDWNGNLDRCDGRSSRVLLFLVRSTNMFNAMKYVGQSIEPG
jgi:hypothetical protein